MNAHNAIKRCNEYLEANKPMLRVGDMAFVNDDETYHGVRIERVDGKEVAYYSFCEFFERDFGRVYEALSGKDFFEEEAKVRHAL